MKMSRFYWIVLALGFFSVQLDVLAQNKQEILSNWKIMKGTDPMNKQFYFKPFIAHQYEKKWSDFPSTGSINAWLKTENTNPQFKPWTVAWSNWFFKAPVFGKQMGPKKFKHYFLKLNKLQCSELEVYINEEKLEIKNPTFGQYFIEQMIDITPFLKGDGTDTVFMGFISPKQRGLNHFRTSGDKFTADNEEISDSLERAFYGGFAAASAYDHRVKISPYFREPAMDFGWDFAHEQVQLGLGEGIALVGWDQLLVEDKRVVVNSVVYNPKERNIQKVYCTARVKINCSSEWIKSLKVDFKLKTDSNRYSFIRSEIQPDGYFLCHFSIDHPRLWYPLGMEDHGKPSLYDGQFVLSLGDSKTGIRRSIETIRFGVRDMKWDTTQGKFQLQVNGRKTMLMGANLVWNSSLAKRLIQGTESEPIPGNELKNWARSGLNCLRIWGGSEYPPESFYTLCDQLGIVVWQDLMFANTLYPSNLEWKNEVSYEIESALNRMNGHACLGLVCGNNEIEVAWKNWGWQQKYHIHGADSVAAWKNYLSLFDTLIPQKLQKIAPTFFYLRSSPIGNWGNSRQMRRGDNHDWGVWHGDRGFNHADSVIAPFVSEFGFPSQATIDSKYPILSYKSTSALDMHIEREWANARTYFNLPYSKGSINKSQIVQDYYLQKTSRAYRTSSSDFGGFLIWQMNDVDSVTSWSLYSEPGFVPKRAAQNLSKLFKSTVSYLRIDSQIHAAVQKNSGATGFYKIEIVASPISGLLENPTLPANAKPSAGKKIVIMNQVVPIGSLYSANLAIPKQIPLGLNTIEIKVFNAKSELIDSYIVRYNRTQ